MIMAVNDLLIDKVVPCPVRYRQGYGKYAYLHECMTCSLCGKHRIINEITIFFIYIKKVLPILFDRGGKNVGR